LKESPMAMTTLAVVSHVSGSVVAPPGSFAASAFASGSFPLAK
jgi:hypothetical protein